LLVRRPPLSPRALLPLSDFDRQEIASNAITLAVRDSKRERNEDRANTSLEERLVGREGTELGLLSRRLN